MSWRMCWAAVVLAACAGLTGCSADPAQQEISGTVTLDGRAVNDGHVRFAPQEGKTPSSEVFIENGKYTAMLTVGNYTVEIYSPRSKGKPAKPIAGPGEDAEEFEETIPARYNGRTELKINVTKDKPEHDFSLKSR